jgi:hypothetical protein
LVVAQAEAALIAGNDPIHGRDDGYPRASTPSLPGLRAVCSNEPAILTLTLTVLGHG